MPKEDATTIPVPDFAELRKRAGVSQEEVALTVGVNQSHISKIERKVIAPSEGLKKRLVDYYAEMGA